MKKLRSLPAVFLMVGLLVGCGGQSAKKQVDLSGRKINVVTTTGMIADIVENVGGVRVEVTALMGPGVDPHLYKASERDVSRLAGADIIFFNGLHLEGAIAELLARMQEQGTTFAVGGSIADSLLLTPPEFAGAHDPHIWFDVTMWIAAAGAVRDKMIKLDPQNTDTYRVNAEGYISRLAKLHEYVLSRVKELPAERRVLITAHDAFNYFGRAYGIEVRGLQGISTVAEAGTADVQQLSRFIADRKIPAIFVESSVPRRSIEAVQAAVRAKGFEVRIGGELFSDAMGSPNTPEGTYIGMVTHNVDTIVEALAEEVALH